MEKTNLDPDWHLNKAKEYMERYVLAEKFIFELMTLPWYKRIFISKIVLKYLKSRKKYD